MRNRYAADTLAKSWRHEMDSIFITLGALPTMVDDKKLRKKFPNKIKQRPMGAPLVYG
jgi:hypothetical protein